MFQTDEELIVKRAITPIYFLERLLQEADELSERIEKLESFTHTETFDKLILNDQELLLEQYPVMKELQLILTKRIARNLIKYSYPATANLPETSEWKDTNWDSELKRAIEEDYSYISTPEGYYYRINSEDNVTGITMIKVSPTKETKPTKNSFDQLPEEIKIKKLSSTNITPEHIESLIKKEEYHIVSERLTICVLTLKNDFEVTGESSCLTPDKFDKQMGEKAARNVAKQKIWQLEGYLLKQKLYEGL